MSRVTSIAWLSENFNKLVLLGRSIAKMCGAKNFPVTLLIQFGNISRPCCHPSLSSNCPPLWTPDQCCCQLPAAEALKTSSLTPTATLPP